jgi:hypothetical protein
MNTTTFENYLEESFSGYTVSSTPPDNKQDYSDFNFYINPTTSSSIVLPEGTDKVSFESVSFMQQDPVITLTETTSTAKDRPTLPNSEDKFRQAVQKIIQNLKNNYEVYKDRSTKSQPTKSVFNIIDRNFGLLTTLYNNSQRISDQFQREIGQLIHKETNHIYISIYGDK